MTKSEAVHAFVERDFNAIPLDWVKAVAEMKGEEIHTWPMWGTMWIVDNHTGEQLMKASHSVYSSLDEATEAEPSGDPQDYVDEEMGGALKIADTAAFIYEIDGQYVVGINGAGWDFYNGVWNKLYDLLGLEWHVKE